MWQSSASAWHPAPTIPQGYFNAYRDMANTELDLVLHLGDYIYEYAEGVYANATATGELGRNVEPSSEILSIEDYRMRYGLYRTDAICRQCMLAILLSVSGMIMSYAMTAG